MADHLVIAEWEWFDDGGITMPHWRFPGGHYSSALDFRDKAGREQFGGTEPGVGIFVTDGLLNLPGILHDFGPDLEARTSLIDRSAIETLLGKRVASASVLEAVNELLLVHGDVTGVNGRKPQRITRRLGSSLTLGNFGKVISDRFSESHPAFQNTIDIFRQDYQGSFDHLPQEKIRKWTYKEMVKLWGRAGDDLMGLVPDEYQLVGWEKSGTIETDTFVDTDTTDLKDHTPTPSDWGQWATVVDGWRINASNQVESQNASQADIVRAEGGLAQDEHYSQLLEVVIDDGGTCTRFDASATSYYVAVYTDTAGATRIFRLNTGSGTNISGDTSETFNNGDSIRLESPGDDNHQLLIDTGSGFVASGSAANDTTHTGANHVDGGMDAFQNNTHDNYEQGTLGDAVMINLVGEGGLASPGGYGMLAGKGGGLVR